MYSGFAQELSATIAGRYSQHKLRIGLSLVIAGVFFPFTGVLISAVWATSYVILQLIERHIFSPERLDRLLSTPRGRAFAIGFVGLNNAVFVLFGVAEILKGDGWTAASGALLISGAILNAVLTSATCTVLFRAAMAPLVLGFLALPAKAMMSGQSLTTGSLLFVGVALSIAAAFSVQRLFHDMVMRLTSARLEAELANNAKSRFLASMSHEIRTPLNGVLGMAHAIAADDLSDVQRERLTVVRQSGETLLLLLNDILDLAKVESGKLELETTHFDLAEIVAGAKATFEALAEEKGLALCADTAQAAGVYRGDPIRVRQIIQNLISNAVKFTAEGEVRIVCAFDGTSLTTTVSDTGIGVADHEIDNLFKSFSQADHSITRRFGGTGLGLSICRQLTELMGGEILCSSVAGQGSSFRFTIPLTRIGDACGPRPQPLGLDAGKVEARVLAAEDHPVNQLVLKAMLAQIGIVPDLVENGQEAVDAWRGQAWDVILMDIQMPVLNGVEAVRAIRAEEAATGRRRTPIIALTANAQSDQLAAYLQAGMDGCVTKPIEAALLYAEVDKALRQAAPGLAARVA